MISRRSFFPSAPGHCVFFCQHGPGIQQIQIVRVLLEGLLQDIPGLVALFVGGQGFGFDQIQLDRVIGLLAALGCQTALGFGGLAIAHQNIGLTQLRRQVIVARPDLGILDQCALRVVTLFSDAPQVQVCRVDMAFPSDQIFQITFGLVPRLGFQADQGQGITQFVIFGVLLHQARELDLGVVHAVLFNQHPRIGQAQAFVVRVFLDAFCNSGRASSPRLSPCSSARAAGSALFRPRPAGCLRAGSGHLWHRRPVAATRPCRKISWLLCG